MNCPQWIELDTRDKIQLSGKIVHLLMNDPDAFTALSAMIAAAEKAGIFDNVRIAPESHSEGFNEEHSFTEGID